MQMSDRTPSGVLDEYLVLRSQSGDAEAFRGLVERWHTRLLGHAFRFTGDAEAARDITQDCWLAIVRGISTLQDPTRFRPWAYRIVANKSRDWVRREQARRRAADVVGAAKRESGAACVRDAVARIREGIARLDGEQRLILTWFYLEEMSVREIADALSIPVGTVKSRLFHARSALRACLEEER